MMQIVKYPDPRLKQYCQPFLRIEVEAGKFADPTFEGLRTFAEVEAEMLENCAAAEGIGLAGPQVGIMRGIIVVNLPNFRKAILNPQIVFAKHRTGMHERCLSFPGRRVYVVRHRLIRAAGFDTSGQPMKIQARGLLATVIQHEVDHLEGICRVAPKEKAA